ncbi:MAG: DOMON domain-containing protein [Planctomycetota bacterium]|jgi:hypothetical protein
MNLVTAVFTIILKTDLAGEVLMRNLFKTCLLLVILSSSSLTAEELFTANHFTVPPVIDGKLDEGVWQKAQTSKIFHIYKKTGMQTNDTEIRAGFDKSWLYFSAKCLNPEPAHMRKKIVKHDDSVHVDESIEILVDPGTKGKLYYHFLLNCANVKAEQRIIVSQGGKKTERSWNLPWRSAVLRTDYGWNAEIALPLYEIAAYGDPEKITFNFVRNKVTPIIDPHGVLVGETREHSSWQAVERSFKETFRFGKLHGVKPGRTEMPFLPSIENLKIYPYSSDGKQFYYNVDVTLKGHNSRKGAVRLNVIDKPSAGKETSVARMVELKGRRAEKVTVKVPVYSMLDRKVKAVIDDAETGNIYQATTAETGTALKPVSVFLNRSYYTSEKTAAVHFNFQLPGSFLKNIMIQVTSGGKVIGQRAAESKRDKLAVELGAFTEGRHDIVASVTDKQGTKIFSEKLKLKKLAPRPGFEWKTDKVNKVILHDEKPFFPIGLVAYSMTATKKGEDEAFAEISAAGFNTVFHWSYVDTSLIETYNKLAAKHNLYVLEQMEGYIKPLKFDNSEFKFTGKTLKAAQKLMSKRNIHFKGTLMLDPVLKALPSNVRNRLYEVYFNKNLPNIKDTLRISGKFENVIGWNTFDEPPDGDKFFAMYNQGRQLYKMIHELDGYRPVFCLYSSHIPPGMKHIDWMDILATDPYWVMEGPLGVKRSEITYVSTVTWRNKQRSEEAGNVVWTVPVAEIWSGVRKRPINKAEQLCQTYLTVIHGSRGIVYFRYPTFSEEGFENLKAAASHLKVIGPAAVQPQVISEVTYPGQKLDPDNYVWPDVQTAVFRDPEGGYLLLAANCRHYPADVTFNISGLTGQVQRAFSDKTYSVSGNKFSDKIESLGVRAYKINAGLSDPVNIEVINKTPASAKTNRPVAVSTTGRQNVKNILPNSSFEKCSNKDWPEYFLALHSGPRIGAPGATWGRDSSEKYDGNHSLKIVTEKHKKNGFYIYLAPSLNYPAEYTFSIYLKGEKPGLKFKVTLPGGAEKTFTLTDTWQRYSMTAKLPANLHPYSSLRGQLLDIGKVWADAMQFEKGSKMTEYMK